MKASWSLLVFAFLVGAEARADEPAVPEPDTVVEALVEAREGEFGQTSYDFCHDVDFGKERSPGKDFCPIFDESSVRVCPEIRNVCAAWEGPRVCVRPDGSEVESAKDCPMGSFPGKSRIARLRPPKEKMELPRIPAPLAWAIVGLFAAWLIVTIYRALRNMQEDQGLPNETVLTEAERNLQSLPETKAALLLAQAQRALDAGQLVDAATLLHLALLRHFDDRGLARYHPSKTNGDYLRAIRRNGALATVFRCAAGLTERIRFGDGTVDAEEISRGIDDAKPLLAAEPEAPTAAALTIVLLLALNLSVACRDGNSADPAYDSRLPTGMAALPTLLRKAGLPVELMRRPGMPPADSGVLVLRTSAIHRGDWASEIDIDRLLDRDINLVIIDDHWDSQYFFTGTSSVSLSANPVALEFPPASGQQICEWRLGAAREMAEDIVLPSGRRLVRNPFTLNATVAASEKILAARPLLTYRGESEIDGDLAGPAWVLERVESGISMLGCVFLFADRDLFTNASLTREGNAQFVAGFFASLAADGRKIVIYDRIDRRVWGEAGGEGEDDRPDPSQPLIASNLLPFLAQGSVLLILFFIAVGAAFGPLRDPVFQQHKAFSEHVEALGRQYLRLGQPGLIFAAKVLARLVVHKNRDQLRGEKGGWTAVSEHLARKFELDENDVRAALRLGIESVDQRNPATTPEPSAASERMLKTLTRLLGSGPVEKKKHRWRVGAPDDRSRS